MSVSFVIDIVLGFRTRVRRAEILCIWRKCNFELLNSCIVAVMLSNIMQIVSAISTIPSLLFVL